MSNTRLTKITDISENRTLRNNSISRLTIHITDSSNNFPIPELLNMMRPRTFGASYNYAVGTDGRIGMSVEENYRAWSTGNSDNDHRAINTGLGKGQPPA